MASALVTCLIFSCYFLDMWNWVSFGQGSYPKATLEVSPGNVTARGGNLTFRCVGLYPSMRFVFYRGSAVLKSQDPPGTEATFLLTDLQQEDEGAFTCSYHTRTRPTIYSDPSDIIQIKVLETYPKPTLEVSPGNVIVRGGNLTFRCVGLYPSMRFLLYRGREVSQTQDPPGTEATFLLTDLQQDDEGAYTCRYHTRTRPTVYADASDIIQIKVLDEEPKKPDKSDKKDDEEPNKPDDPDKNDYNPSTTIIISVVCSVLLVIALIAVIIVYIKHKTNKAGSDSQKSSLSTGAEEIERAAEPMYASVGRAEQRDTAITAEGACQEEYPTYAVINKDALKKHKRAPSSEPTEATVYASVNVH